jgi:SAM-dependent methyltransferase
VTEEKRDTRFFDAMYQGFAEEVYAAIRGEAFGEDIGQNSWTTADEQRTFFEWLELEGSSELLEVASGSGGPALFAAATTGCRVTGIDIHADAVLAANEAAKERSLAGRAQFLEADATEPLSFGEASFDAVICIDSINHLYERAKVLREWHRVLRPGGRILFTDPITLTGLVRREELILRSGLMGEFVFTPPGLDERLVRKAGFIEVHVEDVTRAGARVAADWHAARERRVEDLDRIEGADANAVFQRFLATVATLGTEGRLSRIAYLARKP